MSVCRYPTPAKRHIVITVDGSSRRQRSFFLSAPPKNSETNPSGIRGREGAPGLVENKCGLCGGVYFTLKTDPGWTRPPDGAIACFDCAAYDLTGYDDVTAIVLGLPGTQYVARIVTEGTRVYLVRKASAAVMLNDRAFREMFEGPLSCLHAKW